MTLPAIINTAQTLSFYRQLQSVASNNLANVSTDGFKGDGLTAQSLAGESRPVPAHWVDFGQGDLRDTGGPLDLALQGKNAAFFVVNTPAGERLTRGGSFQVNPNTGEVVDRNGNALLGTGGPIVVGTSGKLQVALDGSVRVNGADMGQLRVETVADPSTLQKQGYGLFIASTPTQAATDISVHQGMVEDSNIKPTTGLLDLINIQRAYASSVDAMREMDGVMSTVTGDIGRVTP